VSFRASQNVPCSRSSPPFGRPREEGIRYRAIGCVYTCAAWRIDAAVIASGYGTTGTVAFAGARALGDRAYEERQPAACPTSERTQTMGKTKDIRAGVEDELIFDPLVDSSDIRVQNTCDVYGNLVVTG
jgi:hypothetical protein